MSRKTNKTITAVGMAALMTAAGVLTAMAAQSPTITAGNGMSQIEAVGPGVQSPDAEQEQAPIWGNIISADNGSIDMDCPSGNVYGAPFSFFLLFPDTELKKLFLFTTKPKLSQARALPFRKRFVSLQKTIKAHL